MEVKLQRSRETYQQLYNRNKLGSCLQFSILSLWKLFYGHRKTAMKGMRSPQDMIYFETALYDV